MQKTLLVILDGLGDRPIKVFNGKTPLEEANTPNMDKLAELGVCGTMNAMPKNLYPTSEEAHLALLGYDFVKDYPGRGVLEALGIGVKLKPDELAFRVDFGTVDKDLKLIDARAGVIESVQELCKAIGDVEIDGVKFTIYPSLLYRGVLVLSGNPVKNYLKRSKSAVSDTDPHKAGPHKLGVRVLHPKAFGDSRDGKTVARALERYQYLTHELLNEQKVNKKRVKKGRLPANFILTRGGGYLRDIESFNRRFGIKAVCIAGAPLYKGIGAYLGMKIIKVRGATGKMDTNIGAKMKAAQKALKKNDFVFLHIKGTDMASEDFGDAKMKREFIEKIDKAIPTVMNLKNVVVSITGDHATPCELKDHSSDIVPVLISGGESKDGVRKFGESYCREGSLGHIYGKDFMGKLMAYQCTNGTNLRIRSRKQV